MARFISLAIALAGLVAVANSIDAEEPRTLDRLARAVADEVRAATEGAGKSPASIDVSIVVRGEPKRLGEDIGALIAGAIGRDGFRSAHCEAKRDDAAFAKAGVDLIVDAEVALAHDGARVDGMVSTLGSSPWSDAVVALTHVHAAAPLDGELRAYLPPEAIAPATRPPPGPLEAHGAFIGDVALLALDVGDVDGDGRAEVVGATAEELVVWRWDTRLARFAELRRVRFPGKLAPTRPRYDVATIEIEHGEIRARSSRLLDGVKVHLEPHGERIEPLAGFPFSGAAVCALDPGVDWFRDTSCAPPSPLPARFTVAAALRGGAARAAIDPDRTLWVWPSSDGKSLSVRGVGPQLALASLARGDVVATGDAVEPGSADGIVVRSLAPGLPMVGRIDRLPGAVAALASGDVKGDGQNAIVAAIRDRTSSRTELWIVY